MTLILNILHKDMSVLAADKNAIAEWLVSPMSFFAVRSDKGHLVLDFNKLTMNSSRTLALGIAGLTKDHCYTQQIEQSNTIDDGLRIIRKHIEDFVPSYDRASLRVLSTFRANEGIATFYDQNMGNYFTYKYLFSPIELQARLHRGSDEVKVFYAGSATKHFVGENRLAEIAELIPLTESLNTPEECIHWMKEVYKRVSESDPEIGGVPTILVSTRSNLAYRSFEHD